MTTKKADYIWFNGEMVRWEDAKVHVMSHALHYGTSVFEGIRCYDSHKGPVVFRHREHMQRLHDSAKIYRFPVSQSIDELMEAYKEGKFTEMFGSGTAAVISPVGKIVDHGKEICLPSGMSEMGPITKKLYDTLTGIQMGRIEAPEGWIKVIE